MGRYILKQEFSQANRDMICYELWDKIRYRRYNCVLVSDKSVKSATKGFKLIIFVQQEDDSDCGGGTCLSPCLWPMLGLQLLLLWLVTSTQRSWPLHPDWHSHTSTHTDHFHISQVARRLSSYAIRDVCKVFATRYFYPHFHSFNAKGCSFISYLSLSETESHLLCSAALISIIHPIIIIIMVQE